MSDRLTGRVELPTVVCYGDSNTHGADPVTGARMARSERWPGVLAEALEGAATVIEEGLNGRTTILDDPFEDGRNGLTYLLPCLDSHAPIDLLVIMLGTNDLKSVFRRSAPEIAAGASALVDRALTSGTGPDGGPPAVLLIAPPALGPATERSELWGFGEARATAHELSRLYRVAAAQAGVRYLDAAAIGAGDPADGIHLNVDAHRVLGRAVAAEVRRMLAGSGTSDRDRRCGSPSFVAYNAGASEAAGRSRACRATGGPEESPSSPAQGGG
jgi:lysophospholipase L1-like esterase